ncbi:hypothetical protein D3C78_532970 [compost metagenome]
MLNQVIVGGIRPTGHDDQFHAGECRLDLALPCNQHHFQLTLEGKFNHLILGRLRAGIGVDPDTHRLTIHKNQTGEQYPRFGAALQPAPINSVLAALLTMASARCQRLRGVCIAGKASSHRLGVRRTIVGAGLAGDMIDAVQADTQCLNQLAETRRLCPR